MKRLRYIALGVGLMTASCASHGGGSAIPTTAGYHTAASVSAYSMPYTLGAGLNVQPTYAAPPPTGWAYTGTNAVGQFLTNDPAASPNAVDSGLTSSSTMLTIQVGLQLRNTAQLNALIANRQIVSEPSFVAQFSPTAAQVAAVTSFLQSNGFTNLQTAPNNQWVMAKGTVAQADAAFNTSIHNYAWNGQTVYANATPALVPSSLGGLVVGVLGITSVDKMQLNPVHTSPAAAAPAAPAAVTPCTGATPPITGIPCVRNYNDTTFLDAYDAGNTPTGGETNVAIMTEGQLTTALSDFRTNEGLNGVRQVPVSTVQVQSPASDITGTDEWDLDMTASSGSAGDLHHIYLYNFGSLAYLAVNAGYTQWVADDIAPIGNSSFGGCELLALQLGGAMVIDQSLAEAAAQGQTMFVSTGDTGSFCTAVVGENGVPAGIPDVEYPASSPFATAVGGTDLFTNTNGTYLGEDAWEAGGGGISKEEKQPAWENPVQPASAAGMRGLPDVVMDAGLETGMDIYLSDGCTGGGNNCVIGGTSLASPLAAGVYARLQSAHGNRVGFGPPAFYQIYVNNPTAGPVNAGPPPTELVGGFNDILSGGNGTYTALPMYDYTTGLGSLDISLMNKFITPAH